MKISKLYGLLLAFLPFLLGIGANIGIHDKDGKLRMHLAEEHLWLLDDKEQPRAVLGKLFNKRTGVDSPVTSLMMFDKDGKVIWRAP